MLVRVASKETWEFCNKLEVIYNYTGIYRDKKMADKLMYIPNNDAQITHSVDNN